ncbi:MAG: 30S ribosomal protein S5 [Candidatus Peribacteria bacterium]|jgi:small subunit ribosomal protein S5|nr:30S ribosomal protein S5 [Candidatus Peribacteria bacterium]
MTPENITEETNETTVVAEVAEQATPETSETSTPAENGERRFSRGGRNPATHGDNKGGRGDRGDRRGDRNREKPKKEFDELLLEVRRVTRVTTGGRRMSFRATILVGNKKGKIGLGISKGNDVAGAVSKATNEAYKALFEVPITKGDTVPYALTYKYKACRVRLLPASAGTGLKAGSSIRAVLELAGYSNILSKMIGANNKLNNALATIQALASYKHADYFSGLREVKGEEKAEKGEIVSASPRNDKTEKVAEKTEKKVEAKKEVKEPVEKKAEKIEKAPAKKPVEKKAPAKKPATKKEDK